jgi:streptogramin lyase
MPAQRAARFLRQWIPVALVLTAAGPARSATTLVGRVESIAGASEAGRHVGPPVVGAMVSASRAAPAAHAVTVFSEPQGGFVLPVPDGTGPLTVRVRRVGFRDLEIPGWDPRDLATLALHPETDPSALAAQLPASRWWALVLERVDDPDAREQLVRQCTYCHQQGSEATRRTRSLEEWEGVLDRMGRMGGIVSPELRARIPDLFNAAYERESATAALSARVAGIEAPAPEVLAARIEEWELGGPTSMQHDLVVHPDGRIYTVDMTQDRVHRLDPAAPDGARSSWPIPAGDLPLGGVLAAAGQPAPPGSNARVGPHSLQVAPDGSIWITLALGNQLARFDPATERFTSHALRHGYYPHTLRFDARGRIWYTIAASNHLGMYDPASGESREIRLPAPSLGQDVTMRLLPAFLWLGRRVDVRGLAARRGQGIDAPVPYGIDVAPDGGVWFSQLNVHRIGRVDPESFAIEIVETPFPAPRRLRFDSQGRLWIPSFSGGLIARFDPRSREFRTFPLPVEPPGSDVPYALNVDRRTDTVWICGTNSDTLLRFDPASERFTIYPLPTRVTYTREIDFDTSGRPWTSNSNSPASQIEGGVPKVIRLDPGPASRTVAVTTPR